MHSTVYFVILWFINTKSRNNLSGPYRGYFIFRHKPGTLFFDFCSIEQKFNNSQIVRYTENYPYK